MKRQSMLVAALLCSLAAASAQADEVYKYVDKTGKAHFSDTPQPGWNKVNITPVKPSADSADQAARAAECSKKTAELDGYKTAAAITEKNALGQVHEYTADERKQLIDATQKDVDSICSPAPPAG